MKMRILIKLILMLAIVSFAGFLEGCEKEFNEISFYEFKTKWEDSINHSSVSWWYIGEEGEYYYIVEKRPLEEHGYKIRKEHLSIKTEHPKELTSQQSEWVNLKENLVDFK